MERPTDVYLNGRIVGNTDDALKLSDEMRNLRRQSVIASDVSISYIDTENELHINTDEGRVVRPLIRVEKGVPILTEDYLNKVKNDEMSWGDLVRRGIIEYLDASEEENTFIALNDSELTEEHTHLEIDPAAIFGVCGNFVPFLNHNMATRVTLGANMSKQGTGLYASNYSIRTDTQKHLLNYPQMPLVRSVPMDLVNYDERASGQNLVVAILSQGGYNMQDAIILNKASIERGIGRTVSFRTYKASEQRYPGGQIDSIEVPDKEVRGYRSETCYRHLGEDGIAETESLIGEEDVIIGKTSPPRFLEVMEEFGISVKNRRESSLGAKTGEGGIADTILISENLEGDKQVKVKLRDPRVPELGDKFSSRHGQKGVVGQVLPQEDSPFTASGIIPDLIVNPHAIPSRMTIGQLLESIGGKLGSIEGRRIDASPFTGESEDDMRAQLEKHGFTNTGKEVMYNGVTGEKLEAEIFVGVVYYQKLKHMVVDKIRARSRGPVQILTRQPTAGKARDGGLRVGEMEKDTFVAHGASLLLKERLLDESDKTTVPVCNGCGLVAVYDRFRDMYFCTVCGENIEAKMVEMSYAFKLLLDEMKSLCIYPRLLVGDKG
ncbi:MAG: DNA-directed RNA polymerase subunit B [Euryarchaeota archaeon]|nr:DNA-directed RNA polymerase subunit B [Euryarchaeota archaeon]|tara:strand:- start:9173 stop:10990 length:1818 start_codon:yes stop_codon:yes gene_type:complete